LAVAAGGTPSVLAGNSSVGYGGDGGGALQATLNGVFSVAVDRAGNVYMADSYNQRIRKVTAGIISTVAGGGCAAGTYTATFKTQYQLTTASNTSAGGSVSPVSGSYFDAGSSVTVTATPVSPYVFSFWSGGAAGSSNPVSVTMNAATTVTGNFVTTAFTCDLTGSGAANAADVQIMIDEALGIIPAVNDLNHDGVVNVLDVQKEIDAALGRGCPY